MSGHSKWSTIKRAKEKTDAQRAKIFTKIGREIAVTVRQGGPDPTVNGKLRDVIAKARSANMPNENVQRCIKKAAGEGMSDNYESIVYEGYGPCGVAVIVEALTDNRNRTAGDMRHYFDKNGGNLGQSGCVSFLFDRKGVIILEEDLDPDKIFDDAISAGADDIVDNVIYTLPNSLSQVRETLEKMGYVIVNAQVEMLPLNTVTLTEEQDIARMNKLLDMLMDNDDVQEVYHSAELAE